MPDSPESWSNSGMNGWAKAGIDLHLEIAGGPRTRSRLEAALRHAVREGRLSSGTRLPSSRQLAADLGVARNTVADVYTQLVAEGYLTSGRGAGTRVAAAPDRPSASSGDDADEQPPRYDLRPGRPDLGIFPRTAWLAATRRVLHAGPQHSLGYSDTRGPASVRRTLAAYLTRVRAVDTDAAHVVSCSGYRQAVALTCAALASAGGRRVAVESPGLPEVTEAILAAGLTPVALQVDDEGARTDLLADVDADLVVLTPAHQFPTGAQLAPDRRTAVVEWSRRTGGVILEDDYDGEFRYDRQPLAALQGLAPEHVVYAGSASKTLAPGLRLGWLVVPDRLLDQVLAAKRLADRHSSALDHLVLADLVEHGDYDRQVRRARLHYRRRRDDLDAALAACSPPRRATGIAAGLHAVVPLNHDAPGILADLERSGVAVNALTRYVHEPPTEALVVGYAAAPQHAWRPALDALTGVLDRSR